MAPTNMACEILVHLPGIQPMPQHEKGRVLTTGLLGKSPTSPVLQGRVTDPASCLCREEKGKEKSYTYLACSIYHMLFII